MCMCMCTHVIFECLFSGYTSHLSLNSVRGCVCVCVVVRVCAVCMCVCVCTCVFVCLILFFPLVFSPSFSIKHRSLLNVFTTILIIPLITSDSFVVHFLHLYI